MCSIPIDSLLSDGTELFSVFSRIAGILAVDFWYIYFVPAKSSPDSIVVFSPRCIRTVLYDCRCRCSTAFSARRHCTLSGVKTARNTAMRRIYFTCQHASNLHRTNWLNDSIRISLAPAKKQMYTTSMRTTMDL